MLAYLGHRRIALQSRGQHDASLRQQLLPLIIKGVDAVLTQLFERDSGRLVLASDNDGVESGVGLQGLCERLSSTLAQLVPGSIELRTPVNRESRDKGKGEQVRKSR